MRKSIILLVDDDRAVLESLEAVLRPAFEEICRIETFDSPEDVLAALPRWTEEKRPIALAIVDQKMPGMSGTRLLARLREAPSLTPGQNALPVEHMKAVLLTGYSELSAAVDAKNSGRIDHYAEKPWDTVALCGIVRALLREHLARSRRDQLLLVREVRTVHELLAHFLLRFSEYSQSSLERVVLDGAGNGLDVDGHDLSSHHLGLFKRSFAGDLLVGTERLVQLRGQFEAALIVELEAEAPEVAARMQQVPKFDLPMMSYAGDNRLLQLIIVEAANRHEAIAETTRFTLAAAEIVNPPRAAAFFVDALHSISLFGLRVIGLQSCRSSHARLYARLGWRRIDGLPDSFNPTIGLALSFLNIRPEWVPLSTRERFERTSRRLNRKGFMCHCPTHPQCTQPPAPYETDDFRGCDLFCPAKAHEILTSSISVPDTSPLRDNPLK